MTTKEVIYELRTKNGMSQDELARKLGKNQSTIANKMRILKLWTRDKTLEDAVEDGYQYAIALVDAIDAVDDSPTVEAAE